MGGEEGGEAAVRMYDEKNNFLKRATSTSIIPFTLYFEKTSLIEPELVVSFHVPYNIIHDKQS